MLTRTSLALLSSLSLVSSAVVVKPRQTVTIPEECNVIPAWEVTTFSWFNSSQNLDCVNQANVRKLPHHIALPPPPSSHQETNQPRPLHTSNTHTHKRLTTFSPANVCFNSTSSGLIACDSGLTACDECGVQGCSTGLPLQPAGYGPPDNVTISIPSVSGYGGCFESNPQSIRRYEVGEGTVLCGGVAYHLELYVSLTFLPSCLPFPFIPLSPCTYTHTHPQRERNREIKKANHHL